jgi:hypothetical protein
MFGQKVAISNLKFNTLCVGLNNPLTIVVSNFPCNKLIIKMNNGTISRLDSCQYKIKPYAIGEVVIEVLVIKGNDTTIVGKMNYQAKQVPDPVTHTDVIADILGFHYKSLKTISAKVDNFDFDTYFNVLSFDVLLQRNIAVIDSLHYDGGQVDDRYLKLIDNCIKDDKIWFDNILVKGEDERTRIIKPFYFKYYDQ